MEWFLVATRLILVHGPDGQVINIHVPEISSIRTPRPDSEGHFAQGTHCLIYMNSGQFISTVEHCEKVVDMINAAGKNQ